MTLLNPKAVDLVSVPQLGDLILCGMCGEANIITITGTRLMTQEEFAELTPEELKDLGFAKRAIQRHQN